MTKEVKTVVAVLLALAGVAATAWAVWWKLILVR